VVEKAEPKCPQCSSNQLYRDGLRTLADGSTVQRWLCRKCGYRFSQGQISNTSSSSQGKRQICDLLQESKNLASVTENQSVAGEGKGLLLDYAWKQKKRGLSDSTIRIRTYLLEKLIEKGADLNDPDSIETVLATEKYSASLKKKLVAAYSAYARTNGISWTPIKVNYQPKQPFIPLESELDQIIAACGKVTGSFLQILKDTGARCGEAVKLKWTDINLEANTISINDPEKGSNSRTIKVSSKTIAMISNLPKKYGEHLFNTNPPLAASLKQGLQLVRKRLARNLQNPRLLQIHFHSFRHWKATMEYHKTKDILHVRELLGHRQIQSTLVYTTLVNFDSEEYLVKRPTTTKEEDELITAGFEYVRFDDREQVPIYRKRK
jgi:integrase/ribosomal protein L37AE/L43A